MEQHAAHDRPIPQSIMSIVDVTVTYRVGSGSRSRAFRALDGVSLEIPAGQTVGIVGESGSGKTTLGRVALGLVKPDAGDVSFRGLAVLGRGARRRMRGLTQVVLQNSDWSLNPRLRVWRSVAEPLRVSGQRNRRELYTAVERMFDLVGLDPQMATRHPHQLSGGQRQRVAIARALITSPQLVVFDEAVSALDVSVQAQVLNLIRDLQRKQGFAALFISHDLGAVRYVADQVAVVKGGKIVESAPVELFYERPDHPYSRELLDML